MEGAVCNKTARLFSWLLEFGGGGMRLAALILTFPVRKCQILQEKRKETAYNKARRKKWEVHAIDTGTAACLL